MSHTLHPLRRQRLQRSTLAVPASNPEMIRKAADSAADVVFLDLEDAVAPPEKPQARRNAIDALNEIDWEARGKTVSVRINGLDTQYMYRDVVDLMEQAGDRLHMILIPKLGVYGDLYMVEALVNQIEMACGLTRKVGLEALIETALGMANVEDIAMRAAQAGSRLEALHFGVADYAASMRARTVNIGGLNPAYPGDQWHASLTRMIVACRAYGLRAIDGPFGDFGDPAGYVAAAERAAALGCEGKWAIHPSQIAMANEVFSPPPAEITRARRIIEELRKAEALGKGAAALDGKMIDAASERMAMNVIALADAIAARSPDMAAAE
jgi:citrate lyase subunit beta/citryl-CoA lyase